ncbi:hypothetical protein LCGC14_0804800 [marine sediment metagenome]|uniref:Uncharacterized protein n=1 Tax=marine sediment metagenome TaxID=412755 RepID=A0A0F9Q8F8_9ZZZZ
MGETLKARIVEFLDDKSFTTKEIAAKLGETIERVKNSMANLKKNNVVKVKERRGREFVYEKMEKHLVNLITHFEKCGADVYFDERMYPGFFNDIISMFMFFLELKPSKELKALLKERINSKKKIKPNLYI